MITHILQQECKIVTTTTDKHGDQIASTETPIACRFRYITSLDKGVNSEALSSEAIIWFDPDANIVEGSIVYADGKYWRIKQLVKARKMSGDTVEFLKAFVDKEEI